MLLNYRGRVITADKLASPVAESRFFTAVNIGVFHINPGIVTDKQFAPSKGLRQQTPNPSAEKGDLHSLIQSPSLLTRERSIVQETLCKRL